MGHSNDGIRVSSVCGDGFPGDDDDSAGLIDDVRTSSYVQLQSFFPGKAPEVTMCD